MVVTTSASNSTQDPWPLPFEWDDANMPAECDEHRLYGLLPCGFQCEAAWLPLGDGAMIACPSCQGQR
jgi:hypothetical protein